MSFDATTWVAHQRKLRQGCLENPVVLEEYEKLVRAEASVLQILVVWKSDPESQKYGFWAIRHEILQELRDRVRELPPILKPELDRKNLLAWLEKFQSDLPAFYMQEAKEREAMKRHFIAKNTDFLAEGRGGTFG